MCFNHWAKFVLTLPRVDLPKYINIWWYFHGPYVAGCRGASGILHYSDTGDGSEIPNRHHTGMYKTPWKIMGFQLPTPQLVSSQTCIVLKHDSIDDLQYHNYMIYWNNQIIYLYTVHPLRRWKISCCLAEKSQMAGSTRYLSHRSTRAHFPLLLHSYHFPKPMRLDLFDVIWGVSQRSCVDWMLIGRTCDHPSSYTAILLEVMKLDCLCWRLLQNNNLQTFPLSLS